MKDKVKDILARVAISTVIVGAFALFCAIACEVCMHGKATGTYVIVRGLTK